MLVSTFTCICMQNQCMYWVNSNLTMYQDDGSYYLRIASISQFISWIQCARHWTLATTTVNDQKLFTLKATMHLYCLCWQVHRRFGSRPGDVPTTTQTVNTWLVSWLPTDTQSQVRNILSSLWPNIILFVSSLLLAMWGTFPSVDILCKMFFLWIQLHFLFDIHELMYTYFISNVQYNWWNCSMISKWLVHVLRRIIWSHFNFHD